MTDEEIKTLDKKREEAFEKAMEAINAIKESLRGINAELKRSNDMIQENIYGK